jgi:branched-subunit amino acid ABC-type transport system permease component
MRILYTLSLLIGIPVAVTAALFLAVTFEDFMTRRFGKPPAWVAIIGIACWLFVFVRLAWDQAGKWVMWWLLDAATVIQQAINWCLSIIDEDLCGFIFWGVRRLCKPLILTIKVEDSF